MSHSPVKIWFNKSGLSNYAVIESIKASAQAGEEFYFIGSHSRGDFALRAICDKFVVEPDGLKGDEYVEWCLQFAIENGVQVFFPDRGVEGITAARERFAAAGVHLMVPTDSATLDIIDHKGRQYDFIGPEAANIPDYRIVSNLAEFDRACAELKERHSRICFKPAVSIFGAGFRYITEDGSAVSRLMNGNNIAVSMEEARFILGQEDSFRDLMVMEYLPGPEYSVDCLAVKGKVVQGVCRVKVADRVQELPDKPEALAAAARLAERFGFDGIFNAQFRNKDGVLYLLEVNARMSGGLYVTFHSGLSLPYWAVRLAVGSADAQDVPAPKTGVRVGQMHRSVTLPD
ncbi:MAG: ATP-grasp domain-containing protein [Candidatus Obscuribacterales bacterium]|nr:ATP-grasp domain-containing protein [Candidatus Obscuribacterales bacterium]